MTTVVLVAVVVVMALGLVAVASLLLGALRQQGSLLLRIESLEERLEALGSTADGQPAPRPEGLPAGADLPPFHLPDFVGRRWSAADLEGEQVLLVNWSPTCGFCERIADDLAALAPALRKYRTELALVSAGDVEANRAFAAEHGLRCPILLLDGSEAQSPFGGLGTPVAYVLDRDRRVSRPLAYGADEVLALASELAGRQRLGSQRPLAESRIQRNGLAAGTPAPDFRLPDLDGGTLGLSDLRGQPVLLVFSSPDCNPCNALAPDLERLHEESAGFSVVVVSRGDAEENRRKRDELGIRYPVLLQPGWRVSRDYGIFETPVAFLVDEDGVIAHDVARGAEEILALAALARELSRAGIEAGGDRGGGRHPVGTGPGRAGMPGGMTPTRR